MSNDETLEEKIENLKEQESDLNKAIELIKKELRTDFEYSLNSCSYYRNNDEFKNEILGVINPLINEEQENLKEQLIEVQLSIKELETKE